MRNAYLWSFQPDFSNDTFIKNSHTTYMSYNPNLKKNIVATISFTLFRYRLKAGVV